MFDRSVRVHCISTKHMSYITWWCIKLQGMHLVSHIIQYKKLTTSCVSSSPVPFSTSPVLLTPSSISSEFSASSSLSSLSSASSDNTLSSTSSEQAAFEFAESSWCSAAMGIFDISRVVINKNTQFSFSTSNLTDSKWDYIKSYQDFYEILSQFDITFLSFIITQYIESQGSIVIQQACYNLSSQKDWYMHSKEDILMNLQAAV